MTMRLDVGARLPIARSVTGAAFLAGLPPVERRLLEDALARRNPDDWEEIRSRISETERQLERDRFAIGLGVFERGMNAVAATLRTPGDEDYFVFTVTNPADRKRVVEGKRV